MSYEYQTTNAGMGDLPTWMQASPFMYGAGPYAPGGPGGGMILGPGKPGAPGAPAGRRTVCVQPPHGPEGVERGRGWPPEIGPQEEALMDAGCIATGRKCGGDVRSPAQAWDCPADMMFPGSVVPHGGGFYGLGNGETAAENSNGGIPWYVIAGAIVVGGTFLLFDGLTLYGEATGTRL